jgi:AraC-like DNA-binding protein
MIMVGPGSDIGLLVSDADLRARLRALLEPLGVPHFTASTAELTEAVATHRMGTVIVELRDSLGNTTVPLVQMLRRDYPSLPILAYCELTPDQVKEIPALVRAGADGVLLKGIDDVGAALRGTLSRSASDRVADEALQGLRRFIPKVEEPVLAYCLRHAYRPITVSEVAGALGVHRKTLCNRAIEAGLPTPSALISWCRLLHAARLLDDGGRSVERTARALGFGSGAALRNMLRRYTGLRPSELRQRGGTRFVITMLQSQIAHPLAD